MNILREKIKECWSGEIFWDSPLKNFTTLKVGGPADALIKPGSKQQLQDLVRLLREHSIPWMVLGRGSNILASDRGVSGVVIVFGASLSAISLLEDVHPDAGSRVLKRVYVEAGCSLAKLGKWCREHSLGGLEFTAGIPGSLGGAVMMNAGAWGGEMKDVLYSLELVTESGQIMTEHCREADFGYRKWHRREGRIIVGATLMLAVADPNEIDAKCHGLVSKRNEKQPKGIASAGSFFKNPENAPAGLLIEKAGLKGAKVGGAKVSEKHANFLVNTGRATAQDFYELMKIVQRTVFDKFEVELEPEVELIGRW